MDFITHLPKTRSGNTAIMVVVDRLSKLVHFIPTVDTANAEAVARLFIDNIFVLHGMPERIVSDRDPRFTGTFWQACAPFGGVRDSSAQHIIHRLMVKLKGSIALWRICSGIWCNPDQNDWDEHLKLAEFACNNAYHTSVDTTPFMLTFGQHPNTPASLLKGSGLSKQPNPSANQFAAEMLEHVQRAQRFLMGAQAMQKCFADEKRREATLSIGQYVKLSTKHIAYRAKGTPELHPKFIGPFQVTDRIGQTAYKILLPQEMRIHNVFHVSLLQPWKHSGGPAPTQVLLVKDDEQFEVDTILDHQDAGSGKRRVRSYLVSWEGHSSENNSWEPECNLKNASATVQDYWTRRKQQA